MQKGGDGIFLDYLFATCLASLVVEPEPMFHGFEIYEYIQAIFLFLHNIIPLGNLCSHVKRSRDIKSVLNIMITVVGCTTTGKSEVCLKYFELVWDLPRSH